MQKIKKNKNKGILFWITGLSGSGKTSIGKKIRKVVIKNWGPTIVISGDNIRKIFKFNKHTSRERQLLETKYFEFAKFVTNQNINLIFAGGLGVSGRLRKLYKKNIDNYVEIYIKTNIKNIIKLKKKKIYTQRNSPIVGIDIKPSIPKKPNIILNNNFKRNVYQLSLEVIKKLEKIYKLN